MSAPKLSKLQAISLLQDYTDDGRITRATGIYEHGHLQELTNEGKRIVGRVPGTYKPYYYVQITLYSSRSASFDCTCPDGGCCKHCGALLLTWATDSKSFKRRSPLKKRLLRKTKKELIDILMELSLTNKTKAHIDCILEGKDIAEYEDESDSSGEDYSVYDI